MIFLHYFAFSQFHLTKGVTISGVCAKKIFGNKKATLVVKDAAHAIWGSNVLASRSVTGTVGSRKRALGEQPKQPLTPEKLLVVSGTTSMNSFPQRMQEVIFTQPGSMNENERVKFMLFALRVVKTKFWYIG